MDIMDDTPPMDVENPLDESSQRSCCLTPPSHEQPFGSCEYNWSSAVAVANREAKNSTKEEALTLFCDSRSARWHMAVTMFPSPCARMSQYLSLLISVVGLPMCGSWLGFSAVSCIAFLFMGGNMICKLVGIRTGVYPDPCAPTNPTCHVVRIIPPALASKARRAENMVGDPGFGVPALANFVFTFMIPLGMLVWFSWPDMVQWQKMTACLWVACMCNPQLSYPASLSDTFRHVCAALSDAIDVIGLWEEETGPLTSKSESGFKEAYRNVEVMSRIIDEFTQSWALYFYLAEFFLVLGLPCAVSPLSPSAFLILVITWHVFVLATL